MHNEKKGVSAEATLPEIRALDAPVPKLFRSLVNRQPPKTIALITVFWNLVSQHPWLLALSVIATVVAATCEGSTLAIIVVAIKVMTGGAASEQAASPSFLADWGGVGLEREAQFLILLLAASVLQIAKAASQVGGAAIMARLQSQIETAIRQDMFLRFLRMPYDCIQKYKIGDLTAYLDQTRFVSSFLSVFSQILACGLISGALASLLIWVSWKLTLVSLLVIVAMFGPVKAIHRRINLSSQQRLKNSVRMTEQSVEYLQAIRPLHIFNRITYAYSRFNRALSNNMAAQRRCLTLQATIKPFLESLTVLGIATLLVAGLLIDANRGAAILPHLIGFLFVLYRLMPQANGIQTLIGNLNDYLPSIKRVGEILILDPSRFSSQSQGDRLCMQNCVEFKSVSFAYPEGPRVLHEVSLEFPKGAMIAVVGASGSGKSTMADLLLRLFEPTSGKILLDGTDIRELPVNQWRELIGTVSQDTFLFNDTIRENIRFGRISASHDEIIEAARIAGAHDFIMATPGGYDAIIGDRGHRLSGGQRQRLAIARAILRDPEILILDEATSNLDNESEQLIQASIQALAGTRTIFAIAHRLSTIAMADQILVLESGRVVEQGTHQTLLSNLGVYSRLWELQETNRNGEDRLNAA